MFLGLKGLHAPRRCNKHLASGANRVFTGEAASTSKWVALWVGSIKFKFKQRLIYVVKEKLIEVRFDESCAF